MAPIISTTTSTPSRARWGCRSKTPGVPAVRANLEVSLRLARLVDEFALPDETEPRR